MRNPVETTPCHGFGWASVLAGAASALLGASSAVAQDTAPLSEKDFLADMPIVLSVSRLPQRLDETPGAVTLLDRDMIRRSGARDVADLLRLVPGFQVSNAFETVAPLVSYHGAFDSYSNRIELLIDGRSAYSPYFIGSIGPGLQTVALADIERIEVLRGSNSAAYGAHAILGVINIVTRHTADTLGAQGAVTVGENGVRDLQASVGWGDDRGTFRLTGDTRADDGLTGSNGHNQVKRVNFRSDLRPTASDEVQVRLGGFAIDSGKGLVDKIDDPLRDAFFDSSYAQIDWRRSLGEDSDMALKLSHSQESYSDKFPYSLDGFPYPLPNPVRQLGPGDIYFIDGSGRASSDAISLQHTFRYGPALRVVWGGEFRSESVTSQALYNTGTALVTDFTRLFGNVEWRVIPSVVVNAGALAEKSSVTGDSVAPRLMVNWHMTDGQTLRVGMSKAFRPPSDFENFSNIRYVYQGSTYGVLIVANGNVQPESVVTHELGYLGEIPKWGLGLDVRLFREQIDGFIRQQNLTSPRYYTNDENFAIQGWEYQLKWRPWQGAQFVFNQTYTDIGTVDTGGSAMAAPKLASSVAYFQKLPWGLDLTLMHQDNSVAILAGSGSQNPEAVTRTDVRLAKSFKAGATNAELSVVVQNLGLPYHDFDPSFTFQRRAFVSLRLEN